MTLRPTIEDSLPLPHIHSIKLISWFLSPNVGPYLSSAELHWRPESCRNTGLKILFLSNPVFILLLLNIHVFAIFAGHTALLTGVMHAQRFSFFFLTCNVDTQKVTSKYCQLSAHSWKAHLLRRGEFSLYAHSRPTVTVAVSHKKWSPSYLIKKFWGKRLTRIWG